MVKYLILFLLGLSTVAGASVLHTDQMITEGLGCSGLSARVETVGSQKQLILVFENMKASLQGTNKEALIQCNFAIPFEVPPTRAVRFFDPSIVGRANIAPRVSAVFDFEMAWPDHRGPNFRVGYISSSQRVSENFSETGVGTELIFGCGENSELIGSVGALMQAGWFYKGAATGIEMSEIRLKVEDVSCQH